MIPKRYEMKNNIFHVNKCVPRNLRLLRNIYGFSQETTASLLHMSRSRYASLECGSRLPDILTLCAVSELYGVTLDHIVTFDITEQMMHTLTNDHGSAGIPDFADKYLELSARDRKMIGDIIRNFVKTERS